MSVMLKSGMILNSTRTSNGAMITIPANSMFNGSCFIGGSITLAATATPRVVVNGTGAEPTNGAIVHQLSLSGLALATITGSGTVKVWVRTGDNPVTLDFNTGGASSATATINGYLV